MGVERLNIKVLKQKFKISSAKNHQATSSILFFCFLYGFVVLIKALVQVLPFLVDAVAKNEAGLRVGAPLALFFAVCLCIAGPKLKDVRQKETQEQDRGHRTQKECNWKFVRSYAGMWHMLLNGAAFIGKN